MGIDLPIDWAPIVVVGLIVAGGIAFCILLVTSYLEWQERRWHKLIDYAAIRYFQEDRLDRSFISKHPVTASDMKEKLESLGQQAVGRDMMGKKIREPNGRFVKQK